MFATPHYDAIKLIKLIKLHSILISSICKIIYSWFDFKNKNYYLLKLVFLQIKKKLRN